MTAHKSKIKIIHDGALGLRGSKVVDAETGEMLPWVERVEVVLDPREGAQAFIYTIAPELDITIEAEITPYERQMAERVANAVMQRLHGEHALIAVELEERMRRRLEELTVELKALNPGLVKE